MNSAPITRGSSSGEAELVKAIVLLAFAAFSLWWSAHEMRWLSIIPALLALRGGLVSLKTWVAFRRGDWQIQWDGSHVKILDRGHLEYDGELAGLHRVEQDGRGYFLYPTPGTVFRLLRRRSSSLFEAALNGIEDAEQAGRGDGDKPSN